MQLHCKMPKTSNEQNVLIHKVAKAFTLLNYYDRKTVIAKHMATAAIPILIQLKSEIIKIFPKYNSKRIRKGVYNHNHAISVLREALRIKDKRLVSHKTYKYDYHKKAMVYIGTAYRVI